MTGKIEAGENRGPARSRAGKIEAGEIEGRQDRGSAKNKKAGSRMTRLSLVGSAD